MKKNRLEIYCAFIAIVVSAIFMRLIPHIPNMTPVGALALFSGMMVPSLGAILIPFTSMVISDMFLGFHATLPYVYGSFALIVGIGYIIRKKMDPFKIGLASIVGSSLFFLITNFGVWATGTMYAKNASGLMESYTMGLPFFRSTLVGDLFFNALFFAGYRFLLFLSKKIVLHIKSLSHYHLS